MINFLQCNHYILNILWARHCADSATRSRHQGSIINLGLNSLHGASLTISSWSDKGTMWLPLWSMTDTVALGQEQGVLALWDCTSSTSWTHVLCGYRCASPAAEIPSSGQGQRLGVLHMGNSSRWWLDQGCYTLYWRRKRGGEGSIHSPGLCLWPSRH